MDEASTPAILRGLRIVLHVSFAALLLIGVLRVVFALRPAHGGVWSVLLLSILLAGTYLLGTVWESRFSQGATTRDPRPLALPWLGTITLLWVVLTLMSPDFSWVAFPLFFVYLVMLRRGPALLSIAVLTGVVILAQYLHAPPGGFSPAMAIGPIVGAVFAVVVGFAYQALYRDAERHRRTARRLEAARAELAEQEREVGRAGERERLAREIHDTLAQGLSSIVLMTRAGQQALEHQDSLLATERLAVIEATAAENLAEARRFVRDLSSPALDADLLAALRELCARTVERARAEGRALDCLFRSEGHVSALPPEHRSLLLRAGQSLLANVSAHAQAGTAVVTLAGWEDAVSLDIVDDGVGFDPEALAPVEGKAEAAGNRAGRADRTGVAGGEAGYGLAKLQARVHELCGTLTIESAPGSGTAVSVRLPLRMPEDQ